MTYLIEGWIDDFRLEATARTAKKAFAEAVDWHVAKQLSAVSISDGSRRYSIAEFSEIMALQEIEYSQLVQASVGASRFGGGA